MVLATALETAIPEITGRIVDNLFSSERSKDTALIYSLTLFLFWYNLFAGTSTN